ncbi:MAG: glycosyltransferase family 39 protein [Planctomycetota bacterium]|nr:glycosyltransferase family 39 protein [Planctomycetota bacterium]
MSRPLLILAAIFALLYAPFLGKALHIDDYYFFEVSKMVGWNPLDTEPSDLPYMGYLLEDTLPYELTHPLGVPYCIKIARAVLGEGEVGLRLAFLFFPLLAVVGMWRLQRAVLPNASAFPLALLALFLAAPAFLVNSQTLMTDYPTLAFLLVGMAMLVAGIESGRTRTLVLGSCSLSAAVLCSYQMAMFPVLVLFYAWIKKRLSARAVLFAALPLAALAVWLLSVYLLHDLFPGLKSRVAEHGAGISGDIGRGIAPQALLRKLGTLLAGIGASCALPLVLRIGRLGLRPIWIAVWAALTVAAWLGIRGSAHIFAMAGTEAHRTGALALFAVVGIFALVIALRAHGSSIEPRKLLLLRLWIAGVVTYTILLMPFGATRYAMPALAPMFLLLLEPVAGELRTRLATVVIALAVLVGLVHARSDYEMADAYRVIADDVGELAPDRDVWYIGEWGMRYYMDAAGFHYLFRDAEPAVGDLVVIPTLCRFWMPPRETRPYLYLLELWEYAPPRHGSRLLPVRLFNRDARAGFYGDWIGGLPFAFSNAPYETFGIFEVRAERRDGPIPLRKR